MAPPRVLLCEFLFGSFCAFCCFGEGKIRLSSAVRFGLQMSVIYEVFYGNRDHALNITSCQLWCTLMAQ
jgi:hypothetical protein